MILFKYMKKALLAGVLFLLPFSALAASFDNNLHYGSTGPEVVALQEFLQDQGVFTGTATGNFYSITLKAVKAFQTAEGITPVSGYVGSITRGVINTLLAEQAPDSEGDATTTQAVVDLSTQPTPVPTPTPTPSPTPSGGLGTSPIGSQPLGSSDTPAPSLSFTTTPIVALTTRGHIPDSGNVYTVDVVTNYPATVKLTVNGGVQYESTSAATTNHFTFEIGVGYAPYQITAIGNGQQATATGYLDQGSN